MPSRVFVLGAGASRADTATEEFPLPLAREFFDDVYLKEYWTTAVQASVFKDSALCKVLQMYFTAPKSVGSSSFKNINVEEVYSFIEAFRNVFIARTFDDELLERARGELLSHIENTIHGSAWHVDMPTLHSRIARSLGGEDSIISFNWDTLGERALEKTVNGRNLLTSFYKSASFNSGAFGLTTAENRIEDNDRGCFIKIHGGINLTACTDPACLRYSYPFVWPHDGDGVNYWPCTQCGRKTRLLIMPPRVQKSYTNNRFFRLQAATAVDKLSCASEIVVIGYSFPAFDFEASAMIRCSRLGSERMHSQASLRRIVIVNPACKGKNYTSAVRDLFGVHSSESYGRKVTFDTYDSTNAYLSKEL